MASEGGLKVRAIVQARTGSTRLPGKVLREVGGKTLLDHVIDRTEQIRGLDGPPIITTGWFDDDDPVAELARRRGLDVYRGNVTDVLYRFLAPALEHKLDAVLRVTADCPLLSPELNSLMVADWRAEPCDYMGPVDSWPRGVLQEIISVGALHLTHHRASFNSPHREHVITWAVEHPDDCHIVLLRPGDYSVDTEADLTRIAPALT